MDPSVMVMARAMVEEINESQSPKNVILSPLSLSALLSILAFGANGETLQQFLRFLGAQDTEELLDKSRAIFALLSSSADGDAETSRSPNRPQGSQDSSADPPESPAMETFNRGHVGREPLIEFEPFGDPWQAVTARREAAFYMANANPGDHRSLERPHGFHNNGVERLQVPPLIELGNRQWPPQPVHTRREPEFFTDHLSLEQLWRDENEGVQRFHVPAIEPFNNHWQAVNARQEPDFFMLNANPGYHQSLELQRSFQNIGVERFPVPPTIEPMNRKWPPQPVQTGREPEFFVPDASWVDHQGLERPWSSENNRVELLEAPYSQLPFSRADDIQMGSHHGREPNFSMANAIWVDHSCRLKPSFVEIAQSEFKASVKNVDLQNESEQVRKDVNAWAEKETKGLIKDLLSEASKPGPPLCLANALYFKGAWHIPFEASNTRDEDFHLLNAETTKVPFMIMYNERLSYGSFPDFKLLKLPYQQGKATSKQFSMYIFLPHQRDGLRSLLEKFRFGCTSLLLENLHLKREELSHVWIPKMKFSHTFEEVQDHIKAVGLTRPFLEYDADFSKIASISEQLFIKSILQKCLIEVNEEGTEAAAVTVCTMRCGCAMSSTPPPPKPSFVADHPFMFMIVEDFTKNIAFTGAVLNPLLTE